MNNKLGILIVILIAWVGGAFLRVKYEDAKFRIYVRENSSNLPKGAADLLDKSHVQTISMAMQFFFWPGRSTVSLYYFFDKSDDARLGYYAWCIGRKDRGLWELKLESHGEFVLREVNRKGIE